MNIAELKTVVEGKVGFVAILKDQLTNDSIVGSEVQKRVMAVETLNANGTKGITMVVYLHNTKTDEAAFYNVAPEAFDNTVASVPQQVVNALEAYCKAKFDAYFLIPDRIDSENKWAVVEAYVLTAGKLVKSNVMVFKKGTNPIAHVTIV